MTHFSGKTTGDMVTGIESKRDSTDIVEDRNQCYRKPEPIKMDDFSPYQRYFYNVMIFNHRTSENCV